MSLSFQKDDLFPLLEETSLSYSEAQDHSELVDRELGLETEAVEAKLLKSQYERHDHEVQAWVGLPVRSLLTPYTELRLLLERLMPQNGESMVDLGAGYGRLAFVIGQHFPMVGFRGYELVDERVQESCRALLKFGYSNVSLKTQDLTAVDFSLPKAEIYFLYDFGSRAAIEKVLQELREISRSQKIRVVGRGRASRDAIERDHPWLSQVYPPEHYRHYSIYFS